MPTHLKLRGQRYIHYEDIFTSYRRHPQDISMSPHPRCAVMASRTIDMLLLPHDKECLQANLVLRGWVWDSHHPAGGNLPYYLIVGVSVQNSKLQKVNA
jgi:hypothetical protein